MIPQNTSSQLLFYLGFYTNSLIKHKDFDVPFKLIGFKSIIDLDKILIFKEDGSELLVSPSDIKLILKPLSKISQMDVIELAQLAYPLLTTETYRIINYGFGLNNLHRDILCIEYERFIPILGNWYKKLLIQIDVIDFEVIVGILEDGEEYTDSFTDNLIPIVNLLRTKSYDVDLLISDDLAIPGSGKI